MALFLRRSILRKFVCVFVLAPAVPVLAQHPPGRVGGAPMPVPAPPIMHAPVYRPPVYQAPIYRSPIYRSAPPPIYAPRLSPMSPARTAGAITFRPPHRPVRPFPPAFVLYFFPALGSPFWPSNYCWWTICDQFWTSTLVYNSGPLDHWSPANYAPPTPETTSYTFGLEREDLPQLFLKDGTVLNVSDYWLIDGQLHFMIVEQDGRKPTEQVVPFDELDLQTTVDENTQRGFRFVLRNEPFEQYLRDHPEGPPTALSPQ